MRAREIRLIPAALLVMALAIGCDDTKSESTPTEPAAPATVTTTIDSASVVDSVTSAAVATDAMGLGAQSSACRSFDAKQARVTAALGRDGVGADEAAKLRAQLTAIAVMRKDACN